MPSTKPITLLSCCRSKGVIKLFGEIAKQPTILCEAVIRVALTLEGTLETSPVVGCGLGYESKFRVLGLKESMCKEFSVLSWALTVWGSGLGV